MNKTFEQLLDEINWKMEDIPIRDEILVKYREALAELDTMTKNYEILEQEAHNMRRQLLGEIKV
jgi:hypothetical protein